jgi:CHAT domain-containing protein
LAVEIPDDSVFVEFLKFSRIPFATLFHPEDETEVHAYLAFVVAGKSKAVTAIACGDAEPIDAAVQEIRQSVHGERGRIELGMAARDSLPPEPFHSSEDPHIRLHRAIVRPLLSALAKNVRRLVIAPDGELCRLPFGALMNPSGEHLIDKFVISYLSSGRGLVEQVAAPATASPPMVFGNPDYEWDGNPSGALNNGKGHTGGRPPSGAADDDLLFQPLPATMAEVQAVSRLLSAQPLIGPSALKSAAMSARSPVVLHFATHGYFLKSEAPEGIGPAMGLPVEAVIGIAAEHAVGDRLSLRIQNPLLRSGIAMAGANAWLKYKTTSAEIGDGLLSAEDIAGMDLSGTQLVVLSACDTGLGDIRLGEGVLGLQRSFAIAGSRTLVMSLWKVPDVVTCLLMERFYANVLQRDQKIDEALQEAQMFVRTITVRDVMDRYGKTLGAGSQPAGGLEWLTGQDDWSCPFVNEAYWGGFVCMGSVGSFSSRASPAIPRSAQTSQV